MTTKASWLSVILAAWAWLLLAPMVLAEEPAPKPRDPEAASGVQASAKKELVFRKPGGTNTMYFVFEPDGTYRFLSREHLFTAVFDRGTWKQDDDGQLLLSSAAERTSGQVFHVQPIQYRGWVFLASADQTFIKIYAPTPEKGKAAIDAMDAEARMPYGLFTATDVDKFRCEVKTPQPFLFHPEMNQPRKQPVFDMTGK